MPLANQIDAEAHKALPETFQSFYQAGDDGNYTVTQSAIDAGIETDVTISALKNAKEHERKQRQEYEVKTKGEMDTLAEQVTALTAQLGEIDDEKLRKAGDTDSLLASKEAKIRAELEPLLKKALSDGDTHKEMVKKLLVKDNATRISSELSVDGNGEALYPHIINRLTLDYDSAGEPKVVVLGKDGKPTVDTLADLKAEIQNTESLSRLVKGSQASGGGADPTVKAGGGAPPKEKSISEMSFKERAERAKKLRAEGKR